MWRVHLTLNTGRLNSLWTTPPSWIQFAPKRLGLRVFKSFTKQMFDMHSKIVFNFKAKLLISFSMDSIDTYFAGCSIITYCRKWLSVLQCMSVCLSIQNHYAKSCTCSTCVKRISGSIVLKALGIGEDYIFAMCMRPNDQFTKMVQQKHIYFDFLIIWNRDKEHKKINVTMMGILDLNHISSILVKYPEM